MKIFLINLDARPDRLHYVAQQLQALQLPFTRWRAVAGNSKRSMHVGCVP